MFVVVCSTWRLFNNEIGMQMNVSVGGVKFVDWTKPSGATNYLCLYTSLLLLLEGVANMNELRWWTTFCILYEWRTPPSSFRLSNLTSFTPIPFVFTFFLFLKLITWIWMCEYTSSSNILVSIPLFLPLGFPWL